MFTIRSLFKFQINIYNNEKNNRRSVLILDIITIIKAIYQLLKKKNVIKPYMYFKNIKKSFIEAIKLALEKI